MIYSALLSLTATLAAEASLPELKNCHSKSHLDPESPGFETGDLKSWKVISGTALLLGTKQAGEEAVGELSYDLDYLYVALMRDLDGKPLLKQIATNNKALVYITWDISKWQGQKVHILVHDSSTAKLWGHINIADIRVGCHVLGDGKGLSFNILGQANQVPQSYSACSSYAADSIRPQYH
ncbi:hypothetical protein FOZG_11879 [Fusarium oxysporum Fo47]|uniref:Uncharacterized protein n=1 Tax=Fusarium oxysporum Fo47 TaxID=660027 RepID=W9JVK3_FUSOX|nr:hypothetical protein FOZG_11879 [Fusarium oxysporum Fo47]